MENTDKWGELIAETRQLQDRIIEIGREISFTKWCMEVDRVLDEITYKGEKCVSKKCR